MDNNPTAEQALETIDLAHLRLALFDGLRRQIQEAAPGSNFKLTLILRKSQEIKSAVFTDETVSDLKEVFDAIIEFSNAPKPIAN